MLCAAKPAEELRSIEVDSIASYHQAVASSPEIPPNRNSQFRANLWWAGTCAILAAVVAASYAPSLGNEFVWDDRANLVENMDFRGLGVDSVRWAFTTTLLGPYQPLSWLTLSADYCVWGLNPAGFRATNIALHALTTILLAVVAARLLQLGFGVDHTTKGTLIGGFAASALFAVHPMRVESVAWITERRDVLNGFFSLLCVLAYIKAASDGGRSRLNRRWYAAMLVFFACSLLSKAISVSLPLVFLILDAYPLRRVASAGLKQVVIEKLPMFAMSFAIGLAAIAGQKSAGAMSSVEAFGLPHRIAQSAYSACYYVRSLAHAAWYPLYERPVPMDAAEARFVASVLCALAVSAVLLVRARRWKAPAAAWFSYLALLAPVSGILQSGVPLVADRYSYLCIMPIMILAGAGVAWLWMEERWPAVRVAASCLIAALIVLWTSLTIRQTHVWKNEGTLWRHVLKNGPSAMAHNNLGSLALQSGDVSQAIDHFADSVRVIATYGRARGNLLNVLMAAMDTASPESLDRAEQTLRALPVWAPAGPEEYFVLGTLAASRGRFEQAAQDFEKVVQERPNLARGWIGLGRALCGAGRMDQALDALRTAARLRPDLAEPHIALAECLIQAGMVEEARTSLLAALRIEPNNSRAAMLLRQLPADGQ